MSDTRLSASDPSGASPSNALAASTGLDGLRAITVSHRAVGVGTLARHSLDCEAAQTLHERLTEAGIPSLVLATCNRAELYWHTPHAADDDTATHAFSRLVGLPAGAGRLTGLAAAAHLFRVCAGLESLVIGEAEILGQVRAALDACAGAGPFLRGVAHAALRAGRQARAETALGVGAQSVASAAVQFLARAMPVDSSHVLVVGAGATGVKVARHLRALGVGRLVVANRTVERAEIVAAMLGAEPAGLNGLQDALGLAHAVVCAVDAPTHVISLDDLRWAAARNGRPLMVVDLSMPPAVEPGEVAGITRADLGALQQSVAVQHDLRAAEIPKALAVIERELRYLESWARRQALRPFVADLRRKLEAIRRGELDRTSQEATQPADGDPGAVDQLTRRLVERMLALPIGAIESGQVALDADQARLLRRLFALDVESEA